MRRLLLLPLCLLMGAPLFAGGFGFGIQAGVFSPTKGLDDNDNSVVAGGHLKFKFATFGIKAELFFLDSSGRYENLLGEEFAGADVDIDNIIAADFMFYPLGGVFFLQAGLNHINLKKGGLDIDVIDNELGLEVGLGATFLDKLMIQGKIMYTPDAIQGDAVDTLRGLDDKNLMGYLVTVGWNF